MYLLIGAVCTYCWDHCVTTTIHDIDSTSIFLPDFVINILKWIPNSQLWIVIAYLFLFLNLSQCCILSSTFKEHYHLRRLAAPTSFRENHDDNSCDCNRCTTSFREKHDDNSCDCNRCTRLRLAAAHAVPTPFPSNTEMPSVRKLVIQWVTNKHKFPFISTYIQLQWGGKRCHIYSKGYHILLMWITFINYTLVNIDMVIIMLRVVQIYHLTNSDDIAKIAKERGHNSQNWWKLFPKFPS